MRLTIWEKKIYLKEMFVVSREAYAYKRCLVVGLHDQGYTGYGEATEFQVYGSEIEAMKRDLLHLGDRIKNIPFTNPVTLWHECNEYLSTNSFAQSALDLAAYDLWGKLNNQPVSTMLDIGEKCYPHSSISIPIETLDKQIERVKRYRAWPYMKFKVAGPEDIEKIKYLRNYTDAVFRVDANCGWTLDAAIRYAEILYTLGVDLIEQPLPADDFEGMKILKQRSPVPLVADESFRGQQYIDKCSEGFHVVNMKLMKIGGITPARAIIKQCRARGLKVMIGCMPESTIGISAIGVLAPVVDYVDMDSIELISNDFADGIKLKEGAIELTSHPGLGFLIHEEFSLN